MSALTPKTGSAMLGLIFTVDSNPLAVHDAASVAALDAALCEAGAGDRRIRLAPSAADRSGNLRCTVHFSELGLLDGFVARLSESLRRCDAGLVGIEAAVPLERAA